jgi:hypothetical protein
MATPLTASSATALKPEIVRMFITRILLAETGSASRIRRELQQHQIVPN